jgi:RimJ/RimL family protein N-acetyltransferase
MADLPEYPIETERLRLRPFTRGDVDAVYAYRRREDVAQFLFDGSMSRESVAEAVASRVNQIGFVDEGDRIVLAVERQSDNHMIGEVSFIWRSIAARQGEIGYVLNPEFQHQGFATEAARALLRFGFDGLALHRIYARCDARNIASSRVMERLGMRREAFFREHTLVKGAWDDEFVYAILDHEWAAQKRS